MYSTKNKQGRVSKNGTKLKHIFRRREIWVQIQNYHWIKNGINKYLILVEAENGIEIK